MPNERPPGRLVRKVARRCLWVVGVLYVVYLVLGNIFVNCPLATQLVNRQPQTLEAHWASARTWWPGQVRLKQLRIRGQARELLWNIDVGQASGRLQLWTLFRRELRFGGVRIADVAINVQPASSDHKPPPWRPDAWWLTFERIETSSLRKLQWGELVMIGNAAGETGFTHQLRGGTTEVFPSVVSASQVALRYRSQPWLQDLSLKLQFAFDRFTHDNPPGWHKIELARLHLVANGATPVLNLGVNSAANVLANSATPHDGRVAADFMLDHGVVAPGGQASWSGVVETARSDGSPQFLGGQASLSVKGDETDGHFSASPAVSSSGERVASHMLVDVRFDSRRVLPLPSSKAALALLSAHAEGRWQFASLAWLKPLTAAKPWLQWNGAGEVDAALRLAHGQLLPGSRLSIPKMALIARILGNIFSGSASADGLVESDPQGAHSTMNLKVEHFVVAPDLPGGEPYLQGQALRVDMRSSADLLRFRDTTTSHLYFAHADVPDLRAYNRYLPGKSLFFISGHGSMATDLTVDGQGDVSAGRMQLHSEGARLAIGPSRLTGNIDLDTRLTMAKRAGHAFDLHDFSLSMNGVRVEGSNDPPWWTTATLEQGQLDWDRPMQLNGTATMRMKDVSLLLTLFAERGAFPQWITHIIDAGEAQVRANVQARKGDFVLDHLVASNERVLVMARLRIAGGKPQGDIYARWGILDLGVAMANGQREFHLLHAARWYEAQPDLLTNTEVVAH